MPIGASRIGYWFGPLEIITSIVVEKAQWGPDSWGGSHAITFNWTTSRGRTGRVNTDYHLSSVLGPNNIKASYAQSLVGQSYHLHKAYLNAGTQFDVKPPSQW